MGVRVSGFLTKHLYIEIRGTPVSKNFSSTLRVFVRSKNKGDVGPNVPSIEKWPFLVPVHKQTVVEPLCGDAPVSDLGQRLLH